MLQRANNIGGVPRGFAFVWRRFELPDLPQPMLACVMVTVPANKLLRDTILEHDPDPRMPAILEDADWQTWLGENDATPEQAKAVLRTMEGVNWKTAPEPRRRRSATQRTRGLSRSRDCSNISRTPSPNAVVLPQATRSNAQTSRIPCMHLPR